MIRVDRMGESRPPPPLQGQVKQHLCLSGHLKTQMENSNSTEDVNIIVQQWVGVQ